MTRDELIERMAAGIGGVYRRNGTVVVWVDEHCKPSKPILRGEGDTIDAAIAALHEVRR